MSTQKNDPPVDTVRHGQTFIKIWRNQLPNGDPIYSSTVGYTYTDKETGEPRNSKSLRDSDLLKLPGLSMRASESIRLFKEADRAHGQEQSQAVGNGYSQANGNQPQQAPPDKQRFRQSRQQAPRGRQTPDHSYEP